MRWILLTITIFFGFLFIFRNNIFMKQTPLIPLVVPTATPQPSKTNDIPYKGEIYRLSTFEVSESETVSLFLNLKEKMTLAQAKEKQDCHTITNGGFYSKSDTPLGLFRMNGKTINSYSKSALLNGFLLIYPNDYIISDQTPNTSVKTALQSGPLLIRNRQPQLLQINNDEPARRMVAAITTSGQLIFLAIYTRDSTFDGPYLADVPTLLKKFEQQIATIITDAINLDGGSASGMITDTDYLGELTYVGSYFCIK